MPSPQPIPLCLSRARPRINLSSPQCNAASKTQIRNATLIPRPHRPYTFTQLLTLSDGSTYLHRTTSPLPVYRSNRDTRNNALWNPSNNSLANVEEDEAGRLRAFRRRFGRGWDAEAATETLEEGREVKLDSEGNPMGEIGESEEQVGRRKEGHEVKSDTAWSQESEDNLMDLIGSFGSEGDGKGDKEGIAMQKRQNLDSVKIAKPTKKR